MISTVRSGLSGAANTNRSVRSRRASSPGDLSLAALKWFDMVTPWVVVGLGSGAPGAGPGPQSWGPPRPSWTYGCGSRGGRVARAPAQVPPARGRPGSLVASGHDAAVDVPDGAGDPAGGRGEQERDGVRQVAGRTGPAERVQAVEAVQGLVELVVGNEPLVDRGGDDGRGDRVDPDVVRPQLDGQVAGKRVQPGLGQRVARRRGGGDGLVGPHAADVDDGPALAVRDHAAGHGLGEEEDRPVQLEVGVVGGAV